jgi:hypothetical protein
MAYGVTMPAMGILIWPWDEEWALRHDLLMSEVLEEWRARRPPPKPGRRGRPDTAEKVRENRARRQAERQGLRLQKSRTRDPRAIDHNLWAVLDGATGEAINPPLAGRRLCSWTLDDVERYLVNRR